MSLLRRAGYLTLTAALVLSTTACRAEGQVGEEGIEAEVDGENEGGEGGGDG